MAKDFGIGQVFAVANKVRNDREQAAIDQFCTYNKLELLHALPYGEKSERLTFWVRQ